MGRDKSTLPFDGVPLAVRVANELKRVAYPVLTVGPEAGTGLYEVDDLGEGPLVAFVAGASALAVRGHAGPILLVACDLPLIDATLLRYLVSQIGDFDAAVPVVAERPQPLCAVYAERAATLAAKLAARGERAMRSLLDVCAVRALPEREWDHIAPPSVLLDVDTPDDVAFVKRIRDEPL